MMYQPQQRCTQKDAISRRTYYLLAVNIVTGGNSSVSETTETSLETIEHIS